MANVFDNEGAGETVAIDGAGSTGSLPVTATINETDRTVSVAQGGKTTTGTTTVGTVPTGKIWRVIGIWFNAASGAGTSNDAGRLLMAGAEMARLYTGGNSTYGYRSNNLSMKFDYNVCPTLTAAQTIVVESFAGYVDCTVWYVEETA